MRTVRPFFLFLVVASVCLFSFRARAARQFTEAERNHWAFRPISHPQPPSLESTRVKNEIDAFILQGLEQQHLSPSISADKATLIRRATFDLIGLPPTPEEVSNFVKDDSPDAFEKVIDRLLFSPHYGERWARHWLDLARYAESEGFKADETRPNVWRYRDYVIKSLNADKPYDRFITEQIAGDELWPNDPDAIVATGFNRHYPDESNARNLRQRRQEILNDITDTVGAVFTGLTYGCARCHDHKFDPILQKDYYRLQAFFANSAAMDEVPLVSATKLAAHDRKQAEWESATRDIRDKMAELEEPERRKIIKDYVDKYPDDIQAILARTPEDRSPFECQMAAKADLYLKPTSHQYIAKTAAVVAQLKGEKKKQWEGLNAQLKEFDKLKPAALPLGTAIEDIGPEAPKTYVLKGGNYDVPTEEVQPGFLSILNPAPVPIFKPLDENSTGRRTALARLLTDPENPLVARVIVNRVWQYHFGKGISASSSDFGTKGEHPTNPELLDWLATDFVRNGWSLKKLHKLIMLSSTYQQSSQSRPEAIGIDPENKLLWRYPRQRLEGEVIRDASLFVAGLLNPEMGGPSVFPDLPGGMDGHGAWKANTTREDQNRRSIYVFIRRNLRYPMFETFDMPDTHESCARRNCTTGPLQALTMLNDKLTLEWAEAFAERVLQKAGADRNQQIETAYRIAFGRPPTDSERSLIGAFFAKQEQTIDELSPVSEEGAVTLNLVLPPSGGQTSAAALVDFCHTLLNSNEFVYLN